MILDEEDHTVMEHYAADMLAEMAHRRLFRFTNHWMRDKTPHATITMVASFAQPSHM